MREILFRAKDEDSKNWVYGNLLQYKDGSCSIREKDSSEHGFKTWIVDPETVGQFTGLTDKNGVKIFEDDILENIDGSVSVVKFGQFKAGKDDWDIEYLPVGFYILFADGGTYCINLHGDGYAIKAEGCSTIGNIHENPELLK